MYSVRSSDLARYINKKYIQHGQRLEGALFLSEVLRVHESNRPYRGQLAVLIGQFRELRRLKTLGALEIVDGVPINKVVVSFQLLLRTIESNDNRVFIKKTRLEQKAPGEFKFENHTKKSKSVSRKGKGKTKYKIIGFVVIALVLIIALLAVLKSCSATRYDSPLSQVTSWKNPNASKWIVHLRSFQTLSQAKLEQGAFSNRKIKIVELDDGRFYLFIVKDTKGQAKSEWSKTVKEEWPKSLIIPLDRCKLKEILGEGYFTCG